MIYALVDLTTTDDRRIRRLNRVLWVVLIVVAPVIGPVAWLSWGKGPRSQAPPFAPDDDPSFSRSSDVTDEEADRRIAELEAQLAALDEEDFEGVPESERTANPEVVAEPEAAPDPEPKPEPKPKPRSKAKPEPEKDTEDDGDAETGGRGRRAPGDGGDSARA